MKTFCIVLLSCLADASAKVDCDTCKESVVKLGTYLTTPEEIEKEKVLLKATVCEPSGDAQGCSDGVDLYWEGMAKALFSYDQTPADVCAAGGLCKTFPRALDCATCEGLIGQLGDLFTQEAFVNSVLEKVGGFLYCDTTDTAAACKTFVDTYGPAAMPALGSGLQLQSGEVCVSLGCE